MTTYDGRAYLEAVSDKYDIIMVDAYQDITIPFQMSSVEFFTMVRDHLTQDGVMVVNMNMHTDKEGNINEYLADTISSVFDNVYIVDVPGTTNRELFASQNGDMILNFEQNLTQIDNPELAGMLQKVSDGLTVYEAGDYLLTDDKAPVELLGMQVIDELIQKELSYYKEIFTRDGIKGILNAF